jgi:hypothetical protein
VPGSIPGTGACGAGPSQGEVVTLAGSGGAGQAGSRGQRQQGRTPALHRQGTRKQGWAGQVRLRGAPGDARTLTLNSSILLGPVRRYLPATRGQTQGAGARPGSGTRPPRVVGESGVAIPTLPGDDKRPVAGPVYPEVRVGPAEGVFAEPGRVQRAREALPGVVRRRPRPPACPRREYVPAPYSQPVGGRAQDEFGATRPGRVRPGCRRRRRHPGQFTSSRTPTPTGPPGPPPPWASCRAGK